MVKDTEYYDVLEVKITATTEEIKKAYRRKAVQLHPDRNKAKNAKEQFQKLAEAYEVLSKPERREIYDLRGKEGIEQTGGVDVSELFAQFFGEGGGMSGIFGEGPGSIFGNLGGSIFTNLFGGGKKESQRTDDCRFTLNVTLEDLYKGKNSKLKISRAIVCTDCNGQGGRRSECMTCKGKGVKIITHQIGPIIQQIQQVCPDCKGERETVCKGEECRACNGRKTVPKDEVIDVHIPPGTLVSEVLTIPGKSDEYPGKRPGNLVISLKQERHKYYIRKGNDLHLEMDLSLKEALTGFSYTVPFLDGSKVRIDSKIEEVIAPDMHRVIKGKGMPLPPSDHGNGYGDMIVTFKVKFPKYLSKYQQNKLEKIL